MNSIIPDKLKEELEDVGKVYNSRSGICVYPNAFSRLQTEIIKVCNKNKDLKEKIEKMKCCSNCNHYNMTYLPYWCDENNSPTYPRQKCDKWEIKENG